MFARLIPMVKTPWGLDVFDYKVEHASPIPGDVLCVPFRRSQVACLVHSLSQESSVAERTKPLPEVPPLFRAPTALLGLLAWTSQRTFCSQPTIWKNWLRQIPRRLKPEPTILPASRRQGQILTFWQAQAQAQLLQRAKEAMTAGQRVLILTPWRTRVERFQAALLGSHGLHSDHAAGQAFRSWYYFISDAAACLISTRLGAWLAPYADLVLLDEPENDDHKQDELTPRYDARHLATWSAHYAGIQLETYGLTPRLTTAALEAPTITSSFSVNFRHPFGHSPIPLIQSDTLEQLRSHDGPHVIIHPVRGLRARIRCRDCRWEATCAHCGTPLSEERTAAICRNCGKQSPPPLHCPHCQGTNLRLSLPGIETLKQAWQQHEPGLSIEWRDTTPEQLDQPFKLNTLAILTDGSLLGGYSEDIRRRERQIIALRRLIAQLTHSESQLIVQGDELVASEWSSFLSTEGMNAWYTKERKERELFHYPPSVKLVKLLLDDSEENIKIRLNQFLPLLPTSCEIRGPFAVTNRANTHRERQVVHLILPSNQNEAELINTLTPLASSAIIDLDPVAFFK